MSMSYLRVPCLLLTLLAAGCGTPEPSSPWAGTWKGTATVTMEGFYPYSYQTQVVVSVSEGVATVSEICPTGGGALTAPIEGSALSWTGSMSCSAFPLAGWCGSVVLTYTSAEASLANDTFTANGDGSATGCSQTRVATLEFSGTKD